jgi:hypothetical protein
MAKWLKDEYQVTVVARQELYIAGLVNSFVITPEGLFGTLVNRIDPEIIMSIPPAQEMPLDPFMRIMGAGWATAIFYAFMPILAIWFALKYFWVYYE